ncbi:hypothetical protein DTO271D3_228 [Paecilomyces variotii]|nr:hypothetical protein DTO271D3_228 [Paecilomyces variotii]
MSGTCTATLVGDYCWFGILASLDIIIYSTHNYTMSAEMCPHSAAPFPRAPGRATRELASQLNGAGHVDLTSSLRLFDRVARKEFRSILVDQGNRIQKLGQAEERKDDHCRHQIGLGCLQQNTVLLRTLHHVKPEEAGQQTINTLLLLNLGGSCVKLDISNINNNGRRTDLGQPLVRCSASNAELIATPNGFHSPYSRDLVKKSML